MYLHKKFSVKHPLLYIFLKLCWGQSRTKHNHDSFKKMNIQIIVNFLENNGHLFGLLLTWNTAWTLIINLQGIEFKEFHCFFPFSLCWTQQSASKILRSSWPFTHKTEYFCKSNRFEAVPFLTLIKSILTGWLLLN